MPTDPALLSQIEATLGGIVQTANLANRKPWDIYEVYLWSLVLEAARTLNAIIRFEDVFGQNAPTLTFRVSPGTVFPASGKPNPTRYTHAVVTLGAAPPLEIHQGIYITGKSGLPHECDVAVITRDEAVACRTAGDAHPRCAKTILAVECKYLTSNPGIDLAREFIGLTADVWNENRFFVCNLSQSAVQKFLTHHKRKWSHDTIPSNLTVVSELRSLFQRVFREYMAAN